MQHYIYLALFFPSKNSISQSARSIWAVRASGVACFSRRSLTLRSRCGKSAVRRSQSGKAIINFQAYNRKRSSFLNSFRAPPGSYIKPDYQFVTKFTNRFTHLNSKKCKKVKFFTKHVHARLVLAHPRGFFALK